MNMFLSTIKNCFPNTLIANKIYAGKVRTVRAHHGERHSF